MIKDDGITTILSNLLLSVTLTLKKNKCSTTSFIVLTVLKVFYIVTLRDCEYSNCNKNTFSLNRYTNIEVYIEIFLRQSGA
jgi:hypothetical protein